MSISDSYLHEFIVCFPGYLNTSDASPSGILGTKARKAFDPHYDILSVRNWIDWIINTRAKAGF